MGRHLITIVGTVLRLILTVICLSAMSRLWQVRPCTQDSLRRCRFHQQLFTWWRSIMTPHVSQSRRKCCWRWALMFEQSFWRIAKVLLSKLLLHYVWSPPRVRKYFCAAQGLAHLAHVHLRFSQLHAEMVPPFGHLPSLVRLSNCAGKFLWRDQAHNYLA